MSAYLAYFCPDDDTRLVDNSPGLGCPACNRRYTDHGEEVDEGGLGPTAHEQAVVYGAEEYLQLAAQQRAADLARFDRAFTQAIEVLEAWGFTVTAHDLAEARTWLNVGVHDG